jgi:phenylalanyl-tRNA synthetase beta chain
MRATSLPSMFETLARNRGYRNDSVRLYELAKVYRPAGETLPDERAVLTLGAYGDCDFFALKGCVEAILREFRAESATFVADTENPSYHPGRCAAVFAGEVRLGTVGQIHPLVAKNYGLPEAFAAELDFPALLAARAPEARYEALPRFPAVTRDIAVVCESTVTVAELTGAIKKAGGRLLREASLFDVYTGAQVPEGKKSAAFSLKFRADERTLTDDEADGAVKNILDELASTLGAVIR